MPSEIEVLQRDIDVEAPPPSYEETLINHHELRNRNVTSQPAVRQSVLRLFSKVIPTKEVVFFSQILVVFGVVVASIYNLSTEGCEQPEMWTALLSSCLGYILPNPKLKRNGVLSNQ